MDSDTPPAMTGEPPPGLDQPATGPETASSADSTMQPTDVPYRGLQWSFIGSEGLRGGWSVAAFAVLFFLIASAEGFVLANTQLLGSQGSLFTPTKVIVSELLSVIALLGAAAIVAMMERRRLMDYYLTGPRRVTRFLAGILTGFAALSMLVELMARGGWLHFGPVALSGSDILRYGLLWACAFLLVGCAEEGIFRCYLQYTLARSINFWWASGIVAAMCIDVFIRSKGNGVWGVYAVALLGLVPCLILHQRSAARGAFWQAAWVTSTLFGFSHTTNNGENWIGIFAAAAIGFIFCVSIRLTGSAWWAIGCHAGWDWAETYFYGTADSGVVAPGHLLTTSVSGNPFWSGGTDGPEGSVLILAVLVMLLASLLLFYRRKESPAPSVAATANVSSTMP